MEELEKMSDFFTARVDEYDERMFENIEGLNECYETIAKTIPQNTETLLDLGCGTGLELKPIFALHPNLAVTGVDLTQAMLDKLQNKYSDKKLELICGDYFVVDFGENKFDCAISSETMHHFSHEKKIGLYSKICKALKEGACYIECDYVARSQEEEDALFAENARIRKENNVPDEEFFHFDTPCTVENQIKLMRAAGFSSIEKVLDLGGTVILLAKK